MCTAPDICENPLLRLRSQFLWGKHFTGQESNREHARLICLHLCLGDQGQKSHRGQKSLPGRRGGLRNGRAEPA